MFLLIYYHFFVIIYFMDLNQSSDKATWLKSDMTLFTLNNRSIISSLVIRI